MPTVYKYRLYCNDESTWKYVWSETSPTTCPTNTSHDINLESITDIEKLASNQVKLNPIDIPNDYRNVGGYYRLKTHSIEVAPNTTSTSTFSFPYPIAVIGGYLSVPDNYEDDCFTLGCGYDTTLGIITQDIVSGATSIVATPTSLQYMRIGGYLRLTDGVNTTEYIEISDINKETNVVTLLSSIPYDYEATSPTYIQNAVIFADKVVFGAGGMYRMGSNSFGATYVPENTVFRITYTNNSSIDTKKPKLFYDYYY